MRHRFITNFWQFPAIYSRYTVASNVNYNQHLLEVLASEIVLEIEIKCIQFGKEEISVSLYT
jgi:hypothetical protein